MTAPGDDEGIWRVEIPGRQPLWTARVCPHDPPCCSEGPRIRRFGLSPPTRYASVRHQPADTGLGEGFPEGARLILDDTTEPPTDWELNSHDTPMVARGRRRRRSEWVSVGYVLRPARGLSRFVFDVAHGRMMRYPWPAVLVWAWRFSWPGRRRP